LKKKFFFEPLFSDGAKKYSSHILKNDSVQVKPKKKNHLAHLDDPQTKIRFSRPEINP